ncbi:MAG: biotin/lipoyl-containing protein [Alkalispirochaeta sp.]
MAEIVVLPQQGNSVEEVVLLDWNVAEGDSVSVGSVLCEVETDKATMEVESTAAGTVLKLLAAAGDEVPVKSPLVVVGEAGEDISRVDLGDTGHSGDTEAAGGGAAAGGPHPTSGEAPSPTPGSAAGDTDSAPRAAAGAESPGPGSPGAFATSGGVSGTSGVSPRARMRAAERAIDPRTISGSGPGGRVIERDVLSAAPRRQQPPPGERQRVLPAPALADGLPRRIGPPLRSHGRHHQPLIAQRAPLRSGTRSPSPASVGLLPTGCMPRCRTPRS